MSETVQGKSSADFIRRENDIAGENLSSTLLVDERIDDDSDEDYLVDTFDFDPFSAKDILELRNYTNDITKNLNEWAGCKDEEDFSLMMRDLYQKLRLELRDLDDLFRFQSDAIYKDSSPSEIEARGERIGERLQSVLQSYDELTELDARQQESVTGGVEEVDSGVPRSVLEDPKTGWFDKDFRTEKGFVEPKLETLTQVGIPAGNGESIGAPLPELAQRPEGIRTGYWGERPEIKTPTEESIPVTVQSIEVAPPSPVESRKLSADESFLRKDWLKSKKVHEDAHKTYQENLKSYYDSLQNASFGKKYWNKAKATLGIKPTLPPEVKQQREYMFVATATYNRLSRSMVSSRDLSGKEDILRKLPEEMSGHEVVERNKRNEAILARYQRMLARTTLLNTFNAQLDLQKEATSNLALTQSEFMKKHSKKVGMAAATAIGGLTGGLAGGGLAAARVVLGGAAAGVATKFVGKGMDSYVEGAADKASEEYSVAVTAIEEMLAGGSIYAEDLEESYVYLSKIYDKVDRAMQLRIVAILGAVIGTGLLVGAGAGAVMEGLDIGTTPSTLESEMESSVSGMPSDAPITTTLMQESYTAQHGDNFWDIMEGETEVGKMTVMEHVDATKQQHLTKLVENYLTEHDDVRSKVGLGSSVDLLHEGVAIDITKLNEVTELVAKENGLYLETPVSNISPDDAVSVEIGSTVEAPVISNEKSSLIMESSSAAGDSTPEISLNETTVHVAKEVVTTQVVTPEKVINFARAYNGGYQKFEASFQANFVEKIQGPATSGGLLSIFFGNGLTTDAFKTFDSYTISEFNKLSGVDRPTLETQFKLHNLDIKDYDAWKSAVEAWKKDSQITFTGSSRFSDVARMAYITSLEQTPGVKK
jgi:hypothetical protein